MKNALPVGFDGVVAAESVLPVGFVAAVAEESALPVCSAVVVEKGTLPVGYVAVVVGKGTPPVGFVAVVAEHDVRRALASTLEAVDELPRFVNYSSVVLIDHLIIRLSRNCQPK